MILMSALRAAARTFAVGPTAFWIIEISIPARSNIPPLLPKSFSMSTTITAVLAVSIAIGAGFASILISLLLMELEERNAAAFLVIAVTVIPPSVDTAMTVSICRRDISC